MSGGFMYSVTYTIIPTARPFVNGNVTAFFLLAYRKYQQQNKSKIRNKFNNGIIQKIIYFEYIGDYKVKIISARRIKQQFLANCCKIATIAR